jgi:hypothetical protein
MLMAGAALVLAIVCVNLAGLMLGRNTARFAKDADRGMSRAKLARHLAGRIEKGLHMCRKIRKYVRLFNGFSLLGAVFRTIFTLFERFLKALGDPLANGESSHNTKLFVT